MTPRISDKALHRLSIPELSGGVNYRDGISQVLDNQLTDCKNVWYKNGLLQTRPGVICADNIDETVLETDFSDKSVRKIYAKKENFRVVDGITYFLVVFQYTDRLVFRYYSDVGKFKPVAEITETPPDVNFTCNIFQHDADIYCFCSGYYEKEKTPYYIFKIFETGNMMFNAVRITDDLSYEEGGFYVPTVMTNGFPASSENETQADMLEKGAELLEGYNLLSNKYHMVFSTANSYETVEDGNTVTSDKMIYSLMWDTASVSYENENVIASITNSDGNVYTHTVTLTGNKNGDIEIKAPKDNLYMVVKGRNLWFTSSGKIDGAKATIQRSNFLRNNMVVTAPCPTSKENYEKVLNMTCAEWFGGGSEGIYDGIHLFIGGNTKESEKALVCWSDFDKPLYFSENCYAYVGDKAQRVTAFGKQGESLIILKERETYATQYSSSDSVINAEAVINQSVVDVTVSEVTFPMVQVHGFIGCDCPNTVQLCRNRLVWAHSDGKVYTLVSANQWNERSILEVSAMVEKKLMTEGSEKMRGALSADWNGHYILSVADNFYLMDYDSYGYASITSYTKNDDAQIHIPWWIWDKPKYDFFTYYGAENVEERKIDSEEKPIEVASMLTVGNELYFVAVFYAAISNGEVYCIPELLRIAGGDDMLPRLVVTEVGIGDAFKERSAPKSEEDGKKIAAMAQTKLFDFGGATVNKSIPKAEISFGNNEGAPITITTITDRGETAREVVLDFEETDYRNPRFFRNVVIRNGERLNNRIGYRLESKGNLFIDALSVCYKILGGCK